MLLLLRQLTDLGDTLSPTPTDPPDPAQGLPTDPSSESSTSSSDTSSETTPTTTDTTTTDTTSSSTEIASSSDTTSSTTTETTSSSSSETTSETTTSSSSKSSSSSSATSSTPPTSTSSSTTTTSSTTESSSSTTQSQSSSSSSSETASFTTITSTDSNGVAHTTTSQLSLSTASSGQSNGGVNRTAIIAGTTIAVLAVVCIALTTLFLWKRRQKQRRGFLEALARGQRGNQGAGAVGLLDAEFDDDDHEDVPMRLYRDEIAVATPRSASSLSSTAYHPPHAASVSSLNSTAPSLIRARATESGSIFQESVWPPPAERSRLVDPFINDIDLGKIVDDVMGPSPSSYNDPFRDASSSFQDHSRETSASTTGSRTATPVKRSSPLAMGATISQNPPPSASKNWIERTPKRVSFEQ